MASFAVTDLTFTTIRSYRKGGNRSFKETFGTIAIPASALTYAAGGVPISGITSPSTGLVVANSIGLACPGLGCPTELLYLTVLSNGNAAGLDDAYVCLFDNACQVEGTAPTTTHKLRLMTRATGAGTVAAPTFTGDALAAHRHTLHFQTSVAANAVTAAANSLRTAAAAFDVAGVANSSGEGGVVDITAGTPTGTNTAPAYTPTAPTSTTGRMIEHVSGALSEALTVYVIAVGW